MDILQELCIESASFVDQLLEERPIHVTPIFLINCQGSEVCRAASWAISARIQERGFQSLCHSLEKQGAEELGGHFRFETLINALHGPDSFSRKCCTNEIPEVSDAFLHCSLEEFNRVMESQALRFSLFSLVRNTTVYASRSLPICAQDGEMILLYTDGLMENEGPTGSTISDRVLKRTLEGCGTALAIKERLLALCELTWQKEPPADDTTFLILSMEKMRISPGASID